MGNRLSPVKPPMVRRPIERLEPRYLLSQFNYAASATELTGITSADFNRDGVPDVAVACMASNPGYTGIIDVLLSSPQGVAAKASYDGGAHPARMISGDFNQDGWPDLAVGNQNSYINAPNAVSVLLNNGDGTFAPRQPYAVSYPFDLAAADLNGDGVDDLCVTNPPRNTVGILLSRGDGTLFPQVSYDTGAFPMSVTVADFNADGAKDLMTANRYDGTVTVLFNRGDGRFGQAIVCGRGDTPFSLASADLNGDGAVDVVVADLGAQEWLGRGSVWGLLNNGDGTFRAGGHYQADGSPRMILAVPMDDGSSPDIVVAHTDGDVVSLWRNRGDGSLAAPIYYPGSTFPYVMTSADFDGDGRLDLAVGAYGTVADLDLTLGTTDPAMAASAKQSLAAQSDAQAGIRVMRNRLDNHKPSGVSLSAATIPENRAARTVVGRLIARDEDRNDSFTYRLISGVGAADNARFKIQGATVRTRQAFDYEARRSYSIRVRVTDLSGAKYDKVFTIGVTDINEPLGVNHGRPLVLSNFSSTWQPFHWSSQHFLWRRKAAWIECHFPKP